MSLLPLLCAHLIGYGPLVLLAVLASRHEKVLPAAYWLAAFGFLVSAPADVWALMLSGDATWVPTHFYPLPQLGLFAWAVSSGLVVFSWSALMLAWATSLALTPLTEPEWFLNATGVVLFVALAIKERKHPLMPALIAYAVVGGLLYTEMIQHVADRDAFMPWWGAYQGSRLAAFALFGRAVWKEKADGR